jgi:hypothetical protein
VNLINEEKSCKVFTKEDVEKAIEVLARAKDILDRDILDRSQSKSASPDVEDMLKSTDFLQSKSQKAYHVETLYK